MFIMALCKRVIEALFLHLLVLVLSSSRDKKSNCNCGLSFTYVYGILSSFRMKDSKGCERFPFVRDSQVLIKFDF